MKDNTKKLIAVAAVVLIAGLTFKILVTGVVNPNNTTRNNTETSQTANEKRIVTETMKQPIAYETQTVDDSTLEYGKTVVRTEGIQGEKTYSYNVTYQGENEISRDLVKEEITKKPVNKVVARGTTILWHCVDATSYNKNPYDDNKCTSSTGEVQYVSDSQSRALDPSYSPGQAGHYWYNSK